MNKIKRGVAVILSLVLVLVALPAMSQNAKTQAAETTFTITSPIENKLLGAGYFDIEWTAATASDVKEYRLYIDDKLVATTDETTYEYYTTEVKMFEAYVEAEYTNGEIEKTDVRSFAVTKKGLAVNDTMGRHLDPLEMSMGWYYTWGTSPFSYTTYKHAEFVPMKWGAGGEDQVFSSLSQKNYKYLLGYNEPDMGGDVGGSNMSVDTALSNWNKFVGVTDYLGAPAPALSPSWGEGNEGGAWFRSFMDQVDQDTIDFIPLHCYYANYGGAAGAETFLKEVVDATYEMYGKPIWVTEFAVSGWGYSNAARRKDVEEFMFTVIDGLNERDYVERYSWFSFNTDDENNGASALWTNATGELTDLGMIYAYYGNPEGYVPTSVTELDPGYKVTTSVRNSAYDDTIYVNNVLCNNYIIEDGVSVSASSIVGNHNAEKAIDGTLDNDSRWESTHGVDPQTFTIDLGSVKNVKQISILWENAAASDYKIEVSTDGVNYTEVAVAEGLGARQRRDDTILLSNLTSAQYIKITGTARATAYGYSIWELAVYGTDDTKIDETTTAAPTTRPVITKPVITTPPEKATTTATPITTTKNLDVGETSGTDIETTTNLSVEPSGESTTSEEEYIASMKRPRKVTIRKINKKKLSAKKITLRIKSVHGATGYTVAIYKTKKAAKKDGKALVVADSSKIKVKVKAKKLANKKKLFVKVSAYVQLKSGTKVYGKWSKIKRVKIK